MSSKKQISTEDKIAFKFFESIEKLYEDINTTIEQCVNVIEDVNEITYFKRIEPIDADIPNIGITLNNKLVEIYQKFKEKGITVFLGGNIEQNQEENKEENIVVLRNLPGIVFSYLINVSIEYAHDEMEGFFNKYEELSTPKDKMLDKIDNSNSQMLNKIRAIIWGLKEKIIPNAIFEIYFSPKEVEDLRKFIEEYKEMDVILREYNLEEHITDTILDFFEINENTFEEIEDFMKNGIEDDLKRLGLQSQIPYIRQKVQERFRANHRSWELTEQEKKQVENQTKDAIAKNNYNEHIEEQVR